MPPLNEVTPPIRLIIRGEFWDSQIYANTLYLFRATGELVTLRWDRLVKDLPIPAELRVAANTALLGNHSLYEPGAQQLLSDPEIRPILISKFHRLAAKIPQWDVELGPDQRIQDNPLPFPHNDSEIHYHRLYVGALEGLFSVASDQGAVHQNGVVRYSDAPALDIAAKFTTIAQASGADGLMEVSLPVGRGRATHRVAQLSDLPCLRCEWAFSSIIASGYESSIYMAAFERTRPAGGTRTNRRSERRFKRLIPDSDFFQHTVKNGFTWGARDKIFRYNDGQIEVVRYRPSSATGPKPPAKSEFLSMGKISVNQNGRMDSVVSARVAPFGSVIEHDEGLIIIPTAGEVHSLDGEPTNWRVFPRSTHYVNHLHVIYEDRLEVWAFTHDYFADQRTKLAGIGMTAAGEA